MNWNEALFTLDELQLRLMVCYLLGRSDVSDEDFIARCIKVMAE
jgi:hypothetical protein